MHINTTAPHLVTGDLSQQLFVVHEHGLYGKVEIQLEDSLVEHFDWVRGVWVDTDSPRHFAVKVMTATEFDRKNEEERRQLFHSLIEHTLRFISWSPEKTHIEF